ncbi:hypothetical protein BH20ACI2_BH20ACI2_05800 [soil metagenome]
MPVWSQEIVDKTVSVVSDGNRTELITYSDLIWQLALQPGAPLDPPRSDDLNQALQTMINQRLFALESRRLPREAPSKAEITRKISETVAFFPSPTAFQARLRQVGFDSVSDEAFEDLIGRRLSIEKYIDFRFGSFVVVTADDEARYYRDVFVPEFRRKTPDLLLPSLEESRNEIRGTLTRQRITTAIETFLDEAKRRVNIEILFEV